MNDKVVNIVGAGLAGLSAAITLSKLGVSSRLISSMPSERAQSVLAEGGINAALDTMGENDSMAEHFADTMKGGCFLESESAVRNLTESAPDIVRELYLLGTPFNNDNGRILLRNFGGQKKKRTAFSKSSTGKMIMTALIDEVRKYEAKGIVTRYLHHELVGINVSNGQLDSITVLDTHTQQTYLFYGNTILCTGGLNGFFEGATTGTTQNTGNAAALAYKAGVIFADLEFIQYHPTTVGISGKRMLISEAARGEGGRLFTLKDGKPWYFMEEKYPELGNLMPRDVVSREMYFVMHDDKCSGEVFLDMTSIEDKVWNGKLSDLRREIISYLKKDPKTEPITVSPGIHFFMGGISVSDAHETNISGLYAAGEAACKYHGANRLGGNSLLGAIYGGKVAAKTASETAAEAAVIETEERKFSVSSPDVRAQLRDILLEGLGIVRDNEGIIKMCRRLEALKMSDDLSSIDRDRIELGIAMGKSALARKESRGAHYRIDFPQSSDDYKKLTIVSESNGNCCVDFIAAEERM